MRAAIVKKIYGFILVGRAPASLPWYWALMIGAALAAPDAFALDRMSSGRTCGEFGLGDSVLLTCASGCLLATRLETHVVNVPHASSEQRSVPTDDFVGAPRPLG